jgi:hypothetical protein
MSKNTNTQSTLSLRMGLFLLEQFVVNMAGRAEGVRKKALLTLSRLGIVFDATPVFLVGAKKVEAVSRLVTAFLDFTPHLYEVSTDLQRAVSYAIGDVYMLAAERRVLGTLLENLAAAKDSTERDSLLSRSAVSVEQYIQLLAQIPVVAFYRVPGIGLWLMDERAPGCPSKNLRSDVEEIAKLGDYLADHQQIRFAHALAMARIAMDTRNDSPLTNESIGRWDVQSEFVERAVVINCMLVGVMSSNPLEPEAEVDHDLAAELRAEIETEVQVAAEPEFATGVEPG